MKISNTRKEIIKLISDYMDKTLSEGCLIITDGYNITVLEEDEVTNDDELVIYRKYEDEFYCIEKIIGHYDITAVLKYIESKGLEICFNLERILIYGDKSLNDDYGNINLKPIYLYTEEEDKQLLELLLKIK